MFRFGLIVGSCYTIRKGVERLPKDVAYGKTIRKSFAKSTEIQDMPNLLEIQKDSYKWFIEDSKAG